MRVKYWGQACSGVFRICHGAMASVRAYNGCLAPSGSRERTPQVVRVELKQFLAFGRSTETANLPTPIKFGNAEKTTALAKGAIEHPPKYAA